MNNPTHSSDIQALGAGETNDPALQLYAEFCAAVARLDTINAAPWPPSGTPEFTQHDQASAAACRLTNEICERAAAVTATSPAGIIAKWAMFSFGAADAVDAGMGDLWRSAFQDVERTGVVPLVPFLADFAAGETTFSIIEKLETSSPNPQDAFADTVAAFEAEAPAPLYLPQAPTDAMVKAGTSATGASSEQVVAMYAAMADAYRKACA